MIYTLARFLPTVVSSLEELICLLLHSMTEMTPLRVELRTRLKKAEYRPMKEVERELLVGREKAVA